MNKHNYSFMPFGINLLLRSDSLFISDKCYSEIDVSKNTLIIYHQEKRDRF